MNNGSDQHRSMGKQHIVTDRLHSFDTGYDVAVFSKQTFPILLPTAYVTFTTI